MPSNRTEKLSQSSDDSAGIMAVVAKQMQASWEKKRKEKENKFLQTAKADLDRCIAGRMDEYTAAVKEMNTVYEKFVMEYARSEDQIRKLWQQLNEEQKKMLELSERKNKAMREADSEREKGQIRGMGIAKKAVEDYGRLITTLEKEN